MKDHEKWYRGEESTSQKFLNTNNWSNKFFTQNQYEISELEATARVCLYYLWKFMDDHWTITIQVPFAIVHFMDNLLNDRIEDSFFGNKVYKSIPFW